MRISPHPTYKAVYNSNRIAETLHITDDPKAMDLVRRRLLDEYKSHIISSNVPVIFTSLEIEKQLVESDKLREAQDKVKNMTEEERYYIDKALEKYRTKL